MKFTIASDIIRALTCFIWEDRTRPRLHAIHVRPGLSAGTIRLFATNGCIMAGVQVKVTDLHGEVSQNAFVPPAKLSPKSGRLDVEIAGQTTTFRSYQYDGTETVFKTEYRELPLPVEMGFNVSNKAPKVMPALSIGLLTKVYDAYKAGLFGRPSRSRSKETIPVKFLQAEPDLPVTLRPVNGWADDIDEEHSAIVIVPVWTD